MTKTLKKACKSELLGPAKQPQVQAPAPPPPRQSPAINVLATRSVNKKYVHTSSNDDCMKAISSHKQSFNFINQTDILIPYTDALHQMDIYSQQAPCVWMLQHPHMYSLGNRGMATDIQNIYDLPIYASPRGGKVTYHGPGQLVVYCFFDLRKTGQTVHEYVAWLEKIIIDILAEFGIQGHTGPHPGIWVNDAKIASIGIRVQKHITSHGFSLNISNDTKYFEPIQVCGLTQAKITTMSHFASVTIGDVSNCFHNRLKNLTSF